LRTFGRRGARPLSARQQSLVENLLPRLAVPVGGEGALAPCSLFDGAREVWLEIGFGGAEHLVEQAARHGDVGFIGCEPFMDGLAKALGGIEDRGLSNIRLHGDDAREVVCTLAQGSLARVFILFPDPWPKARHHKRRLVQPGFVRALARVLAPGARVRFATDVRSYADHALCVFLEDGRFSWTARRAGDWRSAPGDHVTTRYETKRLGDIEPVWFDFTYAPARAAAGS